MKLLRILSLCVLTLFLNISCSDSENSSNLNVDTTRYLELEKSLNSDYSALAAGLRSENSNFNNQNSVLSIASKHFDQASDDYQVFINNYKTVQGNYTGKRLFNTMTLNDIQQQKVDEILGSISSFDNLLDFKSYLDKQFQLIAATNMALADKDFLLTYVISYKAALSFLETNHDLIENSDATNGRADSWWSSWGKCAAGIVGGAVTGAATLGLGGAVVGTVALPVIGTVSAGAVGAVAGAIGGGLTGAVAAC